jgi:hypothetical protein
VTIKASAASDIRTLVSALAGDDEVRREAAIARLGVIGSRAGDALSRAYDAAADTATKVAVLRALESIGDGRAVPIARRAIDEGGDAGVAAASALRALLDAPHAPTATGALDILVSTALNAHTATRVRLAAFDALQDMPDSVRAPVAKALAADPDPRFTARVVQLPREAAAADAVWQDAVEGRLPGNPSTLREAVQARAQSAPLTTLQKMIEAIRGREASVSGRARAAWLALRGTLHQTLALRGSRVALYDLRETIEQAGAALPPSFLTALHVIGDESCLEPIAAAYARAPSDERWRVQLAGAFRAIAKREKITKRSAAMKRAQKLLGHHSLTA